MSFLSPSERTTAAAFSRLSYCNPFTPQRIQLEREVLQEAFVWTDDAWHKRVDTSGEPPNIDLMTARARDLADTIRGRFEEQHGASAEELALYEDVVTYLLYNVHHVSIRGLIEGPDSGQADVHREAPFYRDFLKDLEHYLGVPGYSFPGLEDPVHLFACLFQIRRAFHFIYFNIIGGSMSAARFRASVWESIFTHDMRRYRRALFQRMGEITTLITGPSGTGKELVAQAIGLSRYIPFEVEGLRFADNYRESIYPLNLSALSPTLIESELFGHRKGAFTGALQDRKGWFEVCPPLGTVFLDEIGEIDQMIQVKLLRVIQTRTFQPTGSTESRKFLGKIIAATNRNLADDMDAGRFRADLYYRLCSDIIETPSLRAQIEESPAHLRNLLLFICRRVAGDDEAENLTEEVEDWIGKNLGLDYPWPGNIRELEQCVRNVLIRKTYSPPQTGQRNARDRLANAVREGALSADELITRYYTLVYAQTRNLQETGRRLGVDGRTVKARIDENLLREYGTP